MIDYVTEAEALDDWSDWGAEEDSIDQEVEAMSRHIEKKKARYADNARAQVGATIRCANCERLIVKSSHQTQFCKNKGRGNCKDGYWNSVRDMSKNPK